MEQIYNNKTLFDNNYHEYESFCAKPGKSQSKSKVTYKYTAQLPQSGDSMTSISTTYTQAKNQPKYSNLSTDLKISSTIQENVYKGKDKYYYTVKQNANEFQSYKPQAKRQDSSNINTTPPHFKRGYSAASTQPSSEDSEVFRSYNSEGYKVVQSGKIIHDSLFSDSEGDSQGEFQGSRIVNRGPEEKRFATSISNLGPSSKDISLPGFLKDL